MKLQEKEMQVSELGEDFNKFTTFYLLDYTGMNVAQAVELRRRLRKNSYLLKVVKNRLALRALGEDIPGELRDYFEKPTAVAFSLQDPVGLARLIKDFSNEHKVLKVKAGLVEGQLVGEEKFREICDLPPREQLLGKIGYLMAYPLTQLLRTWQAPLTQIGRLLSQLNTKKVGG